jgi:tetratricopeptide (TPR) repeat protein
MTDWNRFREIQTLRESGHPAEALTEFKTLRESATDAEDRSAILMHEALSYRDLRRFDEAAEAASEAVRLLPEESPNRPYMEFSLACVHESDGKFDLAAQGFRTLLKKHAELLSSDEYIQFRRGVQLRLIASLIMLGHAVEPLSIANALKAERAEDSGGRGCAVSGQGPVSCADGRALSTSSRRAEDSGGEVVQFPGKVR